MLNKNATCFAAAGIIAVGLLILGLIPVEGKSPVFQSGQQQSNKDVLAAVSISKETLLVLLAVGIAGALGLGRKKKNLKGDSQRSEPRRPPDP